jgi:outer membrane protein TolC
MSLRAILLPLLALGVSGCARLSKPVSSLTNSVVRAQSPPVAASINPPASASVGLPAAPLTLRDVINISLKRSTAILTLSGDVSLAGVTTLDPQIAAQAVGQEEGRFNPRLATGYLGRRVDEPPNSFYGPGISTETRYDEANFYARVDQPLTSGGVATLGYDPSLAYLFFPGGVGGTGYNPAYSADFVFRLNQPVFRGMGPRRALTGIRIARARTDQTEWEVQSALNSQIRSLSEAYWNLLAARVRLEAIESVIPLAQESVRLERLRYEAEQVILADVARAEVQVEELLRSRARAIQEYRTRNFQLNQLMGLAPAEATEVLTVDVPVTERLPTDVKALSDVAISRHPDLARIRKQLEIRSMQLYVAERDRLPDVNLLGEYRVSGLSDNVPDALDQSLSLGFPTWTLGVTLEYPLGNRTARSRAKAAELELTRDRLILQRSEEKAEYNIAKLVAALEAAWERYESANRQVQQSREWLRLSGLRYRDPLPQSRRGNWLLLALVDYQNAMQGYVEAVTAASEMLAEYNVILARLDEAQGISMDRWAVEMEARPTAVAKTESPVQDKTDRRAPASFAEAPAGTSAPPSRAPSSRVQTAGWQGHSSYRSGAASR